MKIQGSSIVFDNGFKGQQDDSELNEKKTNALIALGAPKPKNVVTDGNW